MPWMRSLRTSGYRLVQVHNQHGWKLLRVLRLSEYKRVHIYTKCSYLVLHAHAAIWKETRFLITNGSHINIIRKYWFLLLVFIPWKMTVVCWRQHRKGQHEIAEENHFPNLGAPIIKDCRKDKWHPQELLSEAIYKNPLFMGLSPADSLTF